VIIHSKSRTGSAGRHTDPTKELVKEGKTGKDDDSKEALVRDRIERARAAFAETEYLVGRESL
jgi:hypothetical protein